MEIRLGKRCELCHHEVARPGRLLGAVCREAIERAVLAWRDLPRCATAQIADPVTTVATEDGDSVLSKALLVQLSKLCAEAVSGDKDAENSPAR